MSQFKELMQYFWAVTRQDAAQGLTEYAIILMLVAIVVIATLTTLGVTLDTAYYDRLASEMF